MKKTKILSALALASCVMLSGCNKKEEPTVDPSLVVADLPHLVAGQEFDISSYVTAQGGSGSVTITLDASSEGIASVDSTGTKITAAHSGEVKFTVHYGALSADCTVQVDSKEYLGYAELTSEDIYAYSAEQYGFDEDEQTGEVTPYVDEGYYYSPDLYSYLYDEEYAGYVEYDEKVYSFTVIEGIAEGDEDELEFSLEGTEPESLSEVCVAYPLPASAGKQKYVPAEEDEINTTPKGYECISFSGKKSREAAAETLFGLSVAALSHYGISILECQILPEEFEDEGETLVEYFAALFLRGPESMFKQDGDPQKMVDVFFGAYLEFGESLLNQYIKTLLPEEAPKGADASEFFEKVGPKLAAHNFTVSYSFGWFDAQFNPLASNPFYNADSPTLGSYIDDYLNATGSFTNYVTENQTFVCNQVGTSFAAKGLVNYEGDVYSYEYDAATGKYPAVQVAEDTTISEDADLAASPSTYNFLLDLSDVFINEYDEGTLEFSFGAGLPLLYKLFVSAVPEAVKWVAPTNYKEYTELAFDLGNMMYILCEEPFFAMQEVYVKYNENVDAVSLLIMIEDEGTLADGTEATCYYVLSVNIYDFGTTEIPAAVEIEYPAAA